MFSGNYGFFDYKGSIIGYTGQDYDGYGRLIYLIGSIVLLLVLLIVFRKAKRRTINIYLKVLGITMTCLYLGKTIWESYYDITVGSEHAFNLGILPFDTCSLIMYAGLLAGFAKGKLKKLADSRLITGCLVGGVSNLLFLQALKYYPFWTFGAMYSMFWHFIMVFTALWLLITNYCKLEFETLICASIFHFVFSIPVIIFDYITQFDFMLYYRAGGAPLISMLGDKMNEIHMNWVTTIVMVITYFALFAGIIYVTKGIKLGLFEIERRIKKVEEIPQGKEE